MIGRQTRNEEVELQDGKIIEVQLRELTMSEIDDLKKIMIASSKKIKQPDVFQEVMDSYDKSEPVTFLIEKSVEQMRQGFEIEKDTWKIITGQEDVSWLDSCFFSTPFKLFEIFEELNPPLAMAKKKAIEVQRILEKANKELKQNIPTHSDPEQTSTSSIISENAME